MAIKLDTPVKHLLVDLDGTLLHNRNFGLSVDFVWRTIGLLRKHLGLRKATQTLFKIRSQFEKTDATKTNDLRALEILGEAMSLPLEETRKFLRESLIQVFPKLESHFYPVVGSKDFLDWAKEHYKMTLATNPVWPLEIIEMRVRWAGIDPKIFGFVTYANKMKACKPQPQYYRETLEAQGLKAEDCLLIGNELKMDLPATRVGIRVFIVGDYKRLSRLKLKGAKAQAWRGNYKHLKSLLESQLD